MRVRCISNNGKSLSPSWNELGYSDKSNFKLNINELYGVYGMALWRSHLLILLRDESSLPNWYPVDIFDIFDAKVPFGWKFAYFLEPGSLLQALWGYDELVTIKEHYDALLERDEDALRIFLEQCCKQP